MSHLYSRIAHKPPKRLQDNMAVSQTNAWMNAESLNSGGGLSPPPHSDTQQVLQGACRSAPPSPTRIPCGGRGGTQLSPPASPLSPPTNIISSPSPPPTHDPNWQASRPTVRERNAAMFNNQLMADVKFLVGGPDQTQCIPAHKYVLATGSSVFYAMFYGGLAECKQEIQVPDVEPPAFLTLLKYLYYDEIQLEADTVLSTLYVAKKYIVPHLVRACVNYLETSLTAKNACLLLSQSRLFEEPDLMQRCWEVIDAQVCLSDSMQSLTFMSSTASDTSNLTSPSLDQLQEPPNIP